MSEPVPDLRPEGLKRRGSALWDALMSVGATDVARATLAGEAARLTDRLDQLAQLLSGDIEEWARLQHRDGSDDTVLMIDSAAAEARQATNTLRLLLAQLAGDADQVLAGGSIADELARRRAGRGTGT